MQAKNSRSRALKWPLKRSPRPRQASAEYWQLPACVKVRGAHCWSVVQGPGLLVCWGLLLHPEPLALNPRP